MQFAEEDTAVNLCHTLVRIPEEPCLRMTQLLDGSRDRAALAREMGISEEKVCEYLGRLAGLALLLLGRLQPAPGFSLADADERQPHQPG
jgi:hypothetical protein